MKLKREDMLLYAVTNRHWVGKLTLTEQVEASLKGGVSCIQLREKELDEASFLAEAIEIKKLCEKYNVPLIINDNVDIALRCGANGVHVGQTDMSVHEIRALVGEKMIIGVSAKTVEQAKAAELAGADYLGTGAVFSTTTKSDATTISHETLKEICSSVSIPVVAIGGISKNNILSLRGTGIDGVALVSAIFASENIEAECKILKELSYKAVHNG